MAPIPGIDPQFADAVEASSSAWTMGPTDIARRRAKPLPTAESVHAVRDLRRTEHVAADVPIVLFEPATSTQRSRPLVFFVHGGGMITGNRFSGLDRLLGWLPLREFVVASPEYRLAPEHPDPAPADDCWAAFLALVSEAERWGVDPGRVVVVGSSAGGGLAAGLALRARDGDGPAILGLMLMAPMLDDRDATVSTAQYETGVPWDRGTNRTAWNALLGSPRREPVSSYAAPARAELLTGLPPTYLDTGAVDLFRDEGVDYASRLWAAGVPTELHVWPGAVHGFDSLLPDHPVAAAARTARASWISRIVEEAA